jgi:hypothetical protein
MKIETPRPYRPWEKILEEKSEENDVTTEISDWTTD